MRLTKLFIALLCLAVCSMAGAGSLFDNDEVLEVELAGPMHTLVKNKDDRKQLPFVLRLQGIDHEVMVRARGKSRLRVCNFPPLRLSFEPGAMKKTEFDGQTGLKLVTHCRNGDSSEKNVLEEYAAYRIFALLSGVSYRVRLLRVTYTDTDRRRDPDEQRYAFALEPRDHLAERVGGIPLDLAALALSRLNRDHAALVYVFQYMIGNTDWSFVLADNDDKCCHNGDLIEIKDKISYVPYDFDLAGLVNARYAKPDPSLRLKNVRLRRYRGYCSDRETLQRALRWVKAQKTEVLGVVSDLPGFTAKETEKSVEYLSGFFEKAQNEEKLLNKYEKRCL